MKFNIVLSLIGGLLLLLSRFMGVYLSYLSGYLYILSYILILLAVLIIEKQKSSSFLERIKIISISFFGMTLLYSFIVFVFGL